MESFYCIYLLCLFQCAVSFRSTSRSSFLHRPSTPLRSSVEQQPSSSSYNDVDNNNEVKDGGDYSLQILLDAQSPESRQFVVQTIGLTEEQYQKLVQLSALVCDWNTRINLVSRKDCNPHTVWTRHILPSLSAVLLENSPLSQAKSIVDVGTGGGFPGLPLAIAYPTKEFVLMDSVGKKLVAVQDMAHQLGLTNVIMYHGRAEDFAPPNLFDVATGRSVSSLPQFCSFMHHLIDRNRGHLLYWIGADATPTSGGSEHVTSGLEGRDPTRYEGGISSSILDLSSDNVAIAPLLRNLVPTDKRILTFDHSAVQQLARLQGDLPLRTSSPQRRSGIEHGPKRRSSTSDARLNQRPQRSGRQPSKPKTFNASSRGTWQRRGKNRDDNNDDCSLKERGYDNFRRYDSTGITRQST